MSDKIKIVCVVGPTASGKTALGVNVAKALGGEVVSADSMQIYKGMSIASAAPTIDEMCGIKHHLIEFLDYADSFTVADYTALAKDIILDITARGALPVIVGGTGLYINSLVDNVRFTDFDTDLALRQEITDRFERLGAEKMLEQLALFDPETAARLHPNNRRRIIRAFELYEGSGVTITKQNELSKKDGSPYEPIMIGITYRDRQKLYDRINRRVDIMLQNGLLDEARGAFERKDDKTDGAVQAIGHKEFYDYFEGIISLEQAVENLKQSTRRYAKRQLTWFNRDERICWIYADEVCDMTAAALEIIERKE